MFVIKRKGNTEPVNFGKVQRRIEFLIQTPTNLNHVNGVELAQKVIQRLNNHIHTSEIDIYSSFLCASLSTTHIEYGILAGRIAINNHHKNTLNSFRDKIDLLYLRKDVNQTIKPLISDEFYKFVKKNHFSIEHKIDYNRDYLLDFFGFKTLEKSYLLKIDEKCIERPQDVFMRTAIQLHMNTKDVKTCLERIYKSYDHISQQYYTHATPTLFNSGTPNGNLSSCFLLGSEDSLSGIMKTLTDCATISKWSGGIGFHISNWRGSGSSIRGTNGESSGIVPFLKMYNDCARAVDQGGKRKGSFAVYIEPHHPDLMGFLEMRKLEGDDNLRCRDLFSAVWISDLFMKRVQDDEYWSFFCPDKCPNLNQVYGEEYEQLYTKYETQNLSKSTMKARDVWNAIFMAQKTGGIPYICYKDTVNRANMQSNIGIIKSSNLCSEIMLVSDSNNYAVCNLSSICLPKFVEDTYSDDELTRPEDQRRELNHTFPIHPVFNYKKLQDIVGELVLNLNNVIDKTWNPVIETARTNFRNRPIGIGIQGLADVFAKFRVSFESETARNLNLKISETMYYAALWASTLICKEIYQSVRQQINENKPYHYTIYPRDVKSQFPDLRKEDEKIVYETIESVPKTIGAYPSYLLNGGSPLANGQFHWELYGLKPEQLSGLYDWDSLKNHIQIYGVRNSHLIALMPTATTSQIMGCSPCFEPYSANIYKRIVLEKEFVVINKYLMNDLQRTGLWTDQMKQYLLQNEGSIQNINGIPNEMKELYKTTWEIKQKTIIELCADRQPFIDQSQSMNLHVSDLTFKSFNSMQFYAWRRKLKTGCYYLRSQPAVAPQKFTLDPDLIEQLVQSESNLQEQIYNTIPIYETTNECLGCGS